MEERLAAQGQQGGLLLDARAIRLLRDEVARALEAGVALEAAVREALRAWRSDLEQVGLAVGRAAKSLGLSLAPAAAASTASASAATAPSAASSTPAGSNQSLAEQLTLSVAILLRRGEAADLEQAAEGAVAAHQQQQQRARIDAAVQTAAAVPTLAIDLPSTELPSLREAVAAALERGEALDTAARAALAAWREMDAELRQLLGAEAATWRMALTDDDARALTNDVRSERRRGETVAAAVRAVLAKRRHESISRRLAAAMDGALAARTGPGAALGQLTAWATGHGGWGTHATHTALALAEAKAVVLEAACARVGLSVEAYTARDDLGALTPVVTAWVRLHEAAREAVLNEAAARSLRLGEGGLPAAEVVATGVAAKRWHAVLQTTSTPLTVLLRQSPPAAAEGAGEPNGEAGGEAGGEGGGDGGGDGDDDGGVANGGGAANGGGGAADDGGDEAGEAGGVPPADAPSLAALASEAIEELEREAFLQGERAARIGAALEHAAARERLLLTDAAAAVLRKRIAAALQRGEELEAATAAAVAAYHRQLVRRQVQQSTWDPSSNTSRKVSGVLKFMPFKHKDAEFLEYDLLSQVFRYLPHKAIGTLALVSKRWRSVATDPSWKPELLVLAWGREGFSGLSAACPRPTALPFATEYPVVQIACADAATLALTAHGTVWHWGQHWKRSYGVIAAPTRLDELSDVQSIACTVPGYFHEPPPDLPPSTAFSTAFHRPSTALPPPSTDLPPPSTNLPPPSTNLPPPSTHLPPPSIRCPATSTSGATRWDTTARPSRAAASCTRGAPTALAS